MMQRATSDIAADAAAFMVAVFVALMVVASVIEVTMRALAWGLGFLARHNPFIRNNT